MKVRRVVTDNDNEGKSFVKWDSEIEAITRRPGFSSLEMWATKKLPAEVTEEDPAKWEMVTAIGGGSVYRLGLFEPGVEERWHRTDSVDYAIVLSGEMWMQMDKEEVYLKAGDVVIQRGTIHSWANHGKEPCLMLWVLVSTEGGKSSGWQDREP